MTKEISFTSTIEVKLLTSSDMERFQILVSCCVGLDTVLTGVPTLDHFSLI